MEDGSIFTGTLFITDLGVKMGVLKQDEILMEGQFVLWSSEKHGVVKSTFKNGTLTVARYFKGKKIDDISESEFETMF